MYQNGEHKEYVDFSCVASDFLKPLYFRWEVGYEFYNRLQWMQHHSAIPIIASVLYVGMIFGGRLLMKNRPAWNCRKSMAAWNLGLSLFSFVGMIRTLPQLVHNLTSMSIRDNFCKDPSVTFFSGTTGLWVQLFILSKFPELFDTFFVVIHKKPLLFLHWYHHITVLLYCWHSYVTKSPYGLFFVVMNYSVHAIMYGYYFLMAVGMKPKWLNAMFITGAQISQMVVGVIVTVFAFYFYCTESDEQNPCFIHKEDCTAAFIMYGSYLYLFLQFFSARYHNANATSHLKKKA
jgi:hypothetical protein